MSADHILVFCGAKTGNSPVYAQATRALADALCKRSFTVVFGGAHVGLMGVLADQILAQQGKIIGVIPKKLRNIEPEHPGVTDIRIVDSMYQRKVAMAKLSDACVMLPGGVGSLDEFFEMFTLTRLGYQQMPCGILNCNGYFDGLIQFLHRAVAEGFLSASCCEKIVVSDNPDMLLDQLVR